MDVVFACFVLDKVCIIMIICECNRRLDAMAIHYEPYKVVEVRKSNSSYGNWVVRTSEVTFRFFWKKIDAIVFADKHNCGVQS